MKRNFELGDFGLPVHGILIGRGGGFAWSYMDFVYSNDGEVSLLKYSVPDGGKTPNDASTFLLGVATSNEVKLLMAKLDKIDFMQIQNQGGSSSSIRYLVYINELREINFLEWADHEEPYEKDVHVVFNTLRNSSLNSIASLI